MGQMKISEVQQEMLQNAAAELAQVQQQNTVILTAILAGDNIRTAKNVRHEGDMLVWDDSEPDIAPDQDVLQDAVKALTEEAKAKASEGPGATQAGESEGPGASAPEAEKKAESEAAVEAPVG